MPVKKTVFRKPATPTFNKDPATVQALDAAYHLQKVGSLMQAELLYQKVLMVEPGNPFALYALGTIALDRGNAAGAVPLLRQALATGYDHETVITHLGIALQMLGRVDEAMAIYEGALELVPGNPRFHSNVAVVLAQKGDYEGGLARAQTAMKLDPKFAAASMNAGFILQSLDRHVEAAEMFERTLRLDPDNTQVKEALRLLKQKLATQGA